MPGPAWTGVRTKVRTCIALEALFATLISSNELSLLYPNGCCRSGRLTVPIGRPCGLALMLPWLLVVLALLSRTLAAAQLASKQPRVALLFITRGEMPLEPAWTQLLQGVAGLRPPQLTTTQKEEVMEEGTVAGLRTVIRRAGYLTANDTLQRVHCISNKHMRVRTPSATHLQACPCK